jgi:hypothetical protein
MVGVAPRPATSHSIHGSVISAVAASLLALALGAGPVGATTILQDHYADDYAFSHDDCGFTVDVVGHDEGVAHLRVGKWDLASAFFLHDIFSFLETWTRHDTGEWFSFGANGMFNETGATPVGGTVFEFTSVLAGQPFVVWDSDGNVVVRDRGMIRQVLQFDTLGDDVPGGEFVKDVSFSVAGPHPGLEFDLCSLLD